MITRNQKKKKLYYLLSVVVAILTIPLPALTGLKSFPIGILICLYTVVICNFFFHIFIGSKVFSNSAKIWLIRFLYLSSLVVSSITVPFFSYIYYTYGGANVHTGTVYSSVVYANQSKQFNFTDVILMMEFTAKIQTPDYDFCVGPVTDKLNYDNFITRKDNPKVYFIAIQQIINNDCRQSFNTENPPYIVSIDPIFSLGATQAYHAAQIFRLNANPMLDFQDVGLIEWAYEDTLEWPSHLLVLIIILSSFPLILLLILFSYKLFCNF